MPIFGWLIRWGKCHYCKAPFSPAYLYIEVITGLLFAMFPFIVDDKMQLWILYPLASILIVLTVSDLKYRLLPNKIIYPSIVLFVCIRIAIHSQPLWHYALAFLIGAGILMAVSMIGTFMGKTAMGFGDIRLMALLGLVLGIKLVLLSIVLSAFLGSLIGVALIASGKIKRQTPVPYGPFIAIAAIVSFLYGNALIAGYLSLFGLDSVSF